MPLKNMSRRFALSERQRLHCLSLSRNHNATSTKFKPLFVRTQLHAQSNASLHKGLIFEGGIEVSLRETGSQPCGISRGWSKGLSLKIGESEKMPCHWSKHEASA